MLCYHYETKYNDAPNDNFNPVCNEKIAIQVRGIVSSRADALRRGRHRAERAVADEILFETALGLCVAFKFTWPLPTARL